MRIRVTWLDSAYHGQEWPPSPLRLYSALVAGAGPACMTDSQLKDALEHLAMLGPPTIYAPTTMQLGPAAASVPNNDGDVILSFHARGDDAGARRKTSKLRTIRVRHRHQIEGEGAVIYVWTPNSATPSHGPGLRRLAAGLTALGQGIDTAWAVFNPGGDRPEGLRWEPTEQGAHQLAVPYAGVLDILEERYQAARRRIATDGIVRMLAEPQHRRTSYRCELDPPKRRWLLMSLQTPDDRPWSVPGNAATEIAAMSRHAIHQAATRAGLGRETVAALIGHGDDTQRILTTPVPNVGHLYADGRIRRVLLTAPLILDAEIWRAVTYRFIGAELSPPGESAAAVLAPAAQDDRLQRRYVGTARTWTSATPVILPGYDTNRRGKPRPQKAARRLLACAGIDPALVETFTFEPAPLLRGSMRGADARLPRHLAHWPRAHLSIQWRVPVTGPVGPGAGIGYGYGALMIEYSGSGLGIVCRLFQPADMMRPDIAILSPLGRNPGPAHGGITPVIRTLSAGLCTAGARVELLTFTADDRRERFPQLHPDLRIHPLGQCRRWQQARRLERYLAERAPRALLAAGHRANLLAARQAGEGVRILLGVHNALTPGLQRLNLLRRWNRLRVLRRWYPRADGVICVSRGVAQDLQALVPALKDRLHIRYNPIATVDLTPDDQLHPWLMAPVEPVILGAGRLTRQKGFDTLIQAFARVEHQPRPRLLILGEGPERHHLLQLASQLGVAERVALPGFVPNARTQMAAAAVFVLSSVWEGFGNVLVEAMAAGTPVVATDCPSGPREILADGEFGPLTPIGDVDAMALAIQQVLTEPTPATRLLARAVDFAPERIAAQYLELLIPGGLPQPS
ncbi:type I-G CRISPR-associated protein Csb2 [Halochromatium sp.]